MIIGISGKARAGKDTIAEYLVRAHDFERHGFADALKEACGAIFGFSDDQLYGDLKGVQDTFWGFTPREALQRVGTEAMRNGFDENIWTKALWRRIDESQSNNIVIPDVRFPNEAAAVATWGGQLWRVSREGAQATGGIKDHPSEIALDDWTAWIERIDNNGSMDELHTEVDRALIRAKKQRI